MVVLQHPLIEHKLGILRDKNTGTKEFRELVSKIAIFLCYEAMKDVTLQEREITTPLCSTKAGRLDEEQIAFIPILRAGMGMLDGIIKVVPNAKIGHIGIYRNEKTLKPVNYFLKVPENIEKREVFLLDPMLATGGSAVDAISLLKQKGVEKITFLSIIAAPEGIKKVENNYPEVKLYCAHIDDHLYEKGYIVPGLRRCWR